MPALVGELTAALASPDPMWRDEVAYSLLEKWIRRDRVVAAAELRSVLKTCRDNLRNEIGARGDDSVCRRSFSALTLALLAATDLAAPFLSPGEFDGLLAAALGYLADERDVRGFDAERGWLHSVAHTADLLKFLARSPHLAKPAQAEILTAIGGKLAKVDEPLVHGEDERLARAVLSLVARDDFDAAAFATWLDAMVEVGVAEPVSPRSLARQQNRKHVLSALFVVLSLDDRELAAIAKARQQVLAALARLR